MNTPQTAATTPRAKATAEEPSTNPLKNFFAGITIVIIFIVCVLIFMFLLGDPSNFERNDPENGHPHNMLGTVYKGGVIVPVLMTCFLMTVTFSIERFITLARATGTGSIDAFVRRVKKALATEDISTARAECDKQKGSVGNVIRAVLDKYQDVRAVDMAKDQKVLAIQKELEDATALEMPMLEKNLTIIATLASVATLIGLFGTVLGMIKAFSALATAGAPDTAKLSTGISEALINTALGIGTSAIAIIAYNYFTSKIDNLTYSIDEVGFSIMQNFGAKN